jgi:hypothetical protein
MLNGSASASARRSSRPPRSSALAGDHAAAERARIGYEITDQIGERATTRP